MNTEKKFDGKEPADALAQPMLHLEKERFESSADFASRLLASMFQEVYDHTNREMPSEMFDRCSDFVDTLIDAVREEKRNGHL